MGYKDWMPGKREEQLAMAKVWIAELPASNGVWAVSPAEITELAVLAEGAEAAQEAAAQDKGSAVANARAREAYSAMTRYMRLMHQRKFFSPPMEDSDWLRLGLRPRDNIRTPHIEVKEAVEFELKLRGIREILVNFWVKGAAHKAKPSGYDGAVIVWDVLAAPPPEPNSLNRHTMASKTPHALEFTEEERGKTVYIALAWQNERGIIGNWSEIQSAVIP
ncbi:MAG: hypothetical protein LBH43_10860 [Treponema sp.]|jgi:hypothetical protein|nr:hypothetical protein [Treponema sp.]